MSTLDRHSAYPRRLLAYLQERFPPLAQGLLIVSYFSSNQFVALSLEHPGAPVFLSSHSVWGGVLLLCIFFHLRIFDEHKDYHEDCLQHPQGGPRIPGLPPYRTQKAVGNGQCPVNAPDKAVSIHTNGTLVIFRTFLILSCILYQLPIPRLFA